MGDLLYGLVMIVLWPFFLQSLSGYEMFLILPIAAVVTPLVFFAIAFLTKFRAESPSTTSTLVSILSFAIGAIVLLYTLGLLMSMIPSSENSTMVLAVALGPILIAAGLLRKQLALPKAAWMMALIWGGVLTYFLTLRALVTSIF